MGPEAPATVGLAGSATLILLYRREFVFLTLPPKSLPLHLRNSTNAIDGRGIMCVRVALVLTCSTTLF